MSIETGTCYCSRCDSHLFIGEFTPGRRKNGKTICRKCMRDHYIERRDQIMSNIKARRELPEVRERERAWQRSARAKDPVGHLFKGTRWRAKKKGIPFEIDRTDIVIPPICPVLGIALVKVGTIRQDSSPSIERIDPSKGYVKGNVVIVSWRANRLKSDATIEELTKILEWYTRAMRVDSLEPF